MYTYTILGWLQQIQRDYVTTQGDRLELTRNHLCRAADQPISKGTDLFGMGTIQHIATQKNVKAFDFIQNTSNKEAMRMAIDDAIAYIRDQGTEIYNARREDKFFEGATDALEKVCLDQDFNDIKLYMTL